MVTESERALIDALSLCTNRRRSAILTEIVTRFLAAAEVSRGTSKRTALIDFLEECQDEISQKRELFNSLKEEA